MAAGELRTERMDPVDVAWLHMDRPTNLMVVNTVLWFDVPVDQALVLQVFEERVVSRFRRFRQRVADPALTLAPWAAPEWVDEAGFALAEHVSRTRLPAPGDQEALQRAASELASRPLRKDRPLWELHLLEGYGDGGALLLRTHHAIADGGALMQVLLSLTDPLDAGEHTGVLPVHDDTAGPPLLPGPGGRTARRAVAAATRAMSAAGDLSAALRASLTDPRKAAELAGFARADAAMLRKLVFGLTADRNRLQGPLVPGKQRAWTRPVPVGAVKAAGAAAGSTVNDLMMAAITSALRRYLLEHDALAEEVLVIVPVNLRPAGASLPAGLGNEFGLVFVPLPTGEPDPGRLASPRQGPDGPDQDQPGRRLRPRHARTDGPDPGRRAERLDRRLRRQRHRHRHQHQRPAPPGTDRRDTGHGHAGLGARHRPAGPGVQHRQLRRAAAGRPGKRRTAPARP